MRKHDSRKLRDLAEAVVRRIAEASERAEANAIDEGDQQDLVTSLVRQWVTYDGHACLLLDEQPVYFDVCITSAGQLDAIATAGHPGWLKLVTRDWQIDAECLSAITAQLNRGQSAEVTTAEGIPVRLWVDPQTRTHGVEPLVAPEPSSHRTYYHKIAADTLERAFGGVFNPVEAEALTGSVVRQWQRYGGIASLFLVEGRQFLFSLDETADGCTVHAEEKDTAIESLLDSLGFGPESRADVITRFNLDEEVEFRDQEGIPSVLWHDPRERRVRIKALTPPPPEANLSPILCPHCAAVLTPWEQEVQEQVCPLCGHRIAS